MKTITRTAHAASNFVVVVNENYWRSVTDAQCSLLLAAAHTAGSEAADRLIAFEDAAYAELENNGVKIIHLSERELQLWRSCSSDVLINFMAKAGTAGEGLLAAYARLLQQPCCNSVKAREPEN